ncbi:MAG: maleylacetoacetate isomerase [Alphaproteobacteria bacterium]
MTETILYDYFRSSASWRVRIALALKNIPHNTSHISLLKAEHHQPDYQHINPLQMVPALNHQGNIIGQSLAIIEYLEQTHPLMPILPETATEKAAARAFALAIACDIHPLNNMRVLKYLRTQHQLNETAIEQWIQHWIREGFEGLEQILQQRGYDGESFAFAPYPTIAEIFLIPQLYNARRFHTSLDDFPLLLTLEKQALTLKAFTNTSPEQHPNFI